MPGFVRKLLPVLLLLSFANAVAQDRAGTIQVRVTTDRADWTYKPGQPISPCRKRPNGSIDGLRLF